MSKKILMNTNITEQENYRRYYQEYEGTFITVSDKSEGDTLDTSRYIEVTETWGNTVQDENNLEDIQSVGELYVDDEGNPILDDLGKEQYKIEIESCNDINTMDSCIRKDGYRLNGENEDGSPIEQVRSGYSIITVPLHKGLIYVVNSATKIQNIYLFDTKNNFIRRQSDGYGAHKFTVDFNGYAKFTTFTENIPKIYFGINLDYYASSKLPIPPQSNKTTILLPCQLMKVGDVYDRLYWDSEKGKYVVDKNINEYHITNLSIKNNPEVNENVARIDLLRKENIGMTNVKNGGGVIVSNSLKERTYYNDRNSVNCQYAFNNDAGGSWIGFVLPPQFNTNSLFINELVDKNTKFLCQVNTPQLIETNITEKILLPCYEEKTHIFVNSTVDATMKVLVPYKEII